MTSIGFNQFWHIASRSWDLVGQLREAVVKFGVAGIIGVFATTWIQERNSEWQSLSATIKSDADSALAAYASASDLVNARHHAFFRLARAIEDGDEGEEWKAVRKEFVDEDQEWSIGFTKAALNVIEAADLPFEIDARDKLKAVWTLNCRGNPLAGGVPENSALAALQVVNHCTGLVKKDIDARSGFDARDPLKLAPAERDAFLKLEFERLQAAYFASNTLRCLILGRAHSERRSLDKIGFWEFFLGFRKVRYVLPDEKACAIAVPELALARTQAPVQPATARSDQD
jgi:hypothetical protein